MFKKSAVILFLTFLPVLTLSQTQDSSSVDKRIVFELTIGLKKMLIMLKKGEREKAGIWFRKNYYELHFHHLLADSILTNLVKENESSHLLKTNLTTISIAKDSLLTSELHQFIVNELNSIAIVLGELPEIVLPKGFIKDVEKYVIMFSENPKYHSFFQGAINKSRKYIPLIKDHFTEKGFPEELLFFIIIESGFDENAVSKAGAAGMFQFMPNTARQYGLRVNQDTDERFSVFKSAKAASLYLKDLYLELGSINLALTSYNSGSGRTRAALKELSNLKERGFWAIREKSKILAKETREYVPKIFAAIVIAKSGNPLRFQFKDPGFLDENSFATFILPDEINIKRLTDSLKLSLKLFFHFNPDIKPNELTTPKNVTDYPLFVPIKFREKCFEYLIKKFGNKKFDGSDQSNPKMVTLNQKKNEKPKNKKKKLSYNPKFIKDEKLYKEGQQFTYTVKRANTLHLVARIFEVSERNLKKWNKLKFKSLRKDQKLVITAPKTIIKYIYEVPQKISYRRLALQFNVNANTLKKTNNIMGEFLNKGEVVEIYSFK